LGGGPNGIYQQEHFNSVEAWHDELWATAIRVWGYPRIFQDAPLLVNIVSIPLTGPSRNGRTVALSYQSREQKYLAELSRTRKGEKADNEALDPACQCAVSTFPKNDTSSIRNSEADAKQPRTPQSFRTLY
jgi:hypothetical protein